MRFISSFASGHKLPSQLVKELVSALSCCSGPFVGCFPRVWGTWVSWCLRGGQQTRWSIKPAVGHWVWCPCFWGIPQPVWDESSTARGLPSIKSCSQKIVEAGMWFIIQLLHSHFSIQIFLHYVYVSSDTWMSWKELNPLTICYEITIVCTFSLCLFGKEKLEENGVNIPAFLKLSVLSLHRQIIHVHVMARSKCTGINYSSRCFGDFSPLEFLHNTIKQLAVCPQGLGFIKWNALQQKWFWLEMAPLRWGVLFSDL